MAAKLACTLALANKQIRNCVRECVRVRVCVCVEAVFAEIIRNGTERAHTHTHTVIGNERSPRVTTTAQCVLRLALDSASLVLVHAPGVAPMDVWPVRRLRLNGALRLGICKTAESRRDETGRKDQRQYRSETALCIGRVFSSLNLKDINCDLLACASGGLAQSVLDD